ncbi:hypothetical protein, partial [Pseudomonas sp. FSL R10-0765]|uniref:hypothetical protein n=1 Tax=Pseudomonas sp. FSL R10-0765 TaxID=2662195 RepID=UPI001C49AFAE
APLRTLNDTGSVANILEMLIRKQHTRYQARVKNIATLMSHEISWAALLSFAPRAVKPAHIAKDMK